MRHYNTVDRLLIAGAVLCILLAWASAFNVVRFALAEDAPEVIIMEAAPTPTPEPLPTRIPTPLPTATPEPKALPDYDYPVEDVRCLSRGIWSVCPKYPTDETRLAFCEVVQNRVDDDSGAYADSVRYALLQRGEFLDYDSGAYRSRQNNEVADYAMRSWYYAKQTGDRSFRLTPADGVMCEFYRFKGRDYILVMDRSGAVVYDSGGAI